jgi:O-antigen/teichoic acid export membrane protein
MREITMKDIVQPKKGRQQLKAGLILSYCLLVFRLLYGFFFFPFVVSTIGQADYGVYKTIASFSGALSMLDFGISASVTRFVSKYSAENDKEKELKYCGIGLTETMIVDFVVLVVGIGLFFSITPIYSGAFNVSQLKEAHLLYILLLLGVLISQFTSFFNAIITGKERFAFSNACSLFEAVSKIAVSSIAIFVFKNAYALVISFLGASLISLIVQSIYTFAVLKIRPHPFKGMFKTEMFRESLKYIFFVFILAVFDLFNGNIDNILIGSLVGPESVTVYSYALQFYGIFCEASIVISNLMLPKVSKQLANNESANEIEETVIKAGRLQYIVLGGAYLGFAILGKEFVYLWLGDGYSDVWGLGLILMGGALIQLTQNVYFTILKAKGKLSFMTATVGLGAAVNFLITYLGLRFANYYWAAIGTFAASVIFDTIVMDFYYRKTLDMHPLRACRYIYLKTTFVLFFPCSITFIVSFFSNYSWLAFSVEALVFVSVYFVCLLLFGMNDFEKEFIFGKFFSTQRNAGDSINGRTVLFGSIASKKSWQLVAQAIGSFSERSSRKVKNGVDSLKNNKKIILRFLAPLFVVSISVYLSGFLFTDTSNDFIGQNTSSFIQSESGNCVFAEIKGQDYPKSTFSGTNFRISAFDDQGYTENGIVYYSVIRTNNGFSPFMVSSIIDPKWNYEPASLLYSPKIDFSSSETIKSLGFNLLVYEKSSEQDEGAIIVSKDYVDTHFSDVGQNYSLAIGKNLISWIRASDSDGFFRKLKIMGVYDEKPDQLNGSLDKNLILTNSSTIFSGYYGLEYCLFFGESAQINSRVVMKLKQMHSVDGVTYDIYGLNNNTGKYDLSFSNRQNKSLKATNSINRPYILASVLFFLLIETAALVRFLAKNGFTDFRKLSNNGCGKSDYLLFLSSLEILLVVLISIIGFSLFVFTRDLLFSFKLFVGPVILLLSWFLLLWFFSFVESKISKRDIVE